MDYTVNDHVTLIKDALPFRKGDTVKIVKMNEDGTCDIVGVDCPELWIQNVPTDSFL